MKILIVRTLIIYLCVLFAMRLMGKRQLGELAPSELVSTILISNLASISIESPDVPILASLVPLFLITAIELLNGILSYHLPAYTNFISGRANTIIRDGQINQVILRRIGLNTGELLEALRGKDVFDLDEVSYAIIETNGSLSVAKKPAQQPASRAECNLNLDAQKAVVPFVIDGKVLKANLSWCNKGEQWLRQAAAEHSTTPEDILVLFGDDSTQYYLIKKEKAPHQGAQK
ncbi:MAG: DUF421 domain-containing protein [Faecalibacterium sp.]